MNTSSPFIHKVSVGFLALIVLTAVFTAKADITKVRAEAPVTPVTPPIISSSNGGSAGGGANSGVPACTNTIPSAPNLFQAKSTKNSVTLYFSPSNGNVTYYMTAFGFNYLDDRFGGQFPLNRPNQGVQSITVNHLVPNTVYFFRVRGGDGCMPGAWSNTLIVTTNGKTFHLYK